MLDFVRKLQGSQSGEKPSNDRILARKVARQLTDEELDSVSGACCGTTWSRIDDCDDIAAA